MSRFDENTKTEENKKQYDEPGGSSSSGPPPVFWAVIIIVVVSVWMLSGFFTQTAEKTTTPKTAEQKTEKLFKVRAQIFNSQQKQTILTVRGRTEADARVEIKAETAGLVRALDVDKGAKVKKGDILCRLDIAEREANLVQAKAKLLQAQADYEANVALAKKGHTAELKVSAFKAQLDAAKAELTRMELDFERTKITAPFAGVVEEQHAKIGDFLPIGAPCASIVALDPLKIIAQASQNEVGGLNLDMPAEISLVTGQTAKGKISYIATSSDRGTRTFRIEVTVPNPEGLLRDGVTADLKIPLKSIPAHLLSSSILVLKDSGQIGVNTLTSDQTVQFMPVTLLSDNNDGVWVTGLPDQVKVITVGQDYVVDNQKVDVSEQTAEQNKSGNNGS